MAMPITTYVYFFLFLLSIEQSYLIESILLPGNRNEIEQFNFGSTSVKHWFSLSLSLFGNENAVPLVAHAFVFRFLLRLLITRVCGRDKLLPLLAKNVVDIEVWGTRSGFYLFDWNSTVYSIDENQNYSCIAVPLNFTNLVLIYFGM